MNRIRYSIAALSTVGLLGIATVACSSYEPTKSDIESWALTARGPIIKFSDDLKDTSVTPENCTVLKDDVKSLKQLKPYPGKPVEWKTALSEYEAGFNDCINGNYAGLTTHLIEGNDKFRAVYQDLRDRGYVDTNRLT